tara:strand:- start:1996 stop:2994 length:999 start_codon:yes stop_codon:yes gene_type:complete
MSKKICIVGGAGFIGHNLAIKLKKYGHNVQIIDSLSVNNYYSLENDNLPNPKLSKFILDERTDLLKKMDIDTIINDARDYHLVSRSIDKFSPDVLIQLAAVSHANRSIKDPYSTFDHSLRTLENTLDATKGKIGHYIYFSSSMVYGNFKKDIVDEDTVCEPIDIYGSLKYSGELIVKAYGNVFKTPFTIIRPSALYGERCISRRVGQIFIENALMQKPIVVKGGKTQFLDFTYIEDLTEGVVSVINSQNSINQVFNLTYGESRSVQKMSEILKDHFPEVKISYEEDDPFIPKRGTLNVNKAKNLLNYSPQNNLEVAYPKYIDWYKNLWNQLN